MRKIVVIVAAVLVVATGAGTSRAQEQRPAPGGMGPGGQMGGQMGGMMGGMMGGGMMAMGGMHGRDHLEHLMVHNPKAAARIMRFRADMLRAMGEVLQRHAAELEKAQ